MNNIDYEILPAFDDDLNRRLMKEPEHAPATDIAHEEATAHLAPSLEADSMEARLEEARAAEREACVELIEQMMGSWRADDADTIVSAIRKRGETHHAA